MFLSFSTNIVTMHISLQNGREGVGGVTTVTETKVEISS